MFNRYEDRTIVTVMINYKKYLLAKQFTDMDLFHSSFKMEFYQNRNRRTEYNIVTS